MEHNDPARTARADQVRAGDESSARTLLLELGAADLDARPWEPAGMPPSAVDLVRFFLWWSGRGDPGGTGLDGPDGPDAARAALALLPAARAELDQVETALLFTARGAGLTWAQMADALGMNSPQACQQRLDRLLARRGRDDRGRTT
ncbi:DNA-binding protein [Cellulomonas sp. NS3]|uniref:DNA-binding protein n=1 Tax=Cellulomonas sp. NS3 TaxID=2973977 RepID=UPI002162B755|nr:DNA-binding protein [Cellulomonas sp. NS3]